MKRHVGYKECCLTGGIGTYERLYEDFGNIHEKTFEDWWPEHEHLFKHLPPFTLTVIESLDQLPAQDLNDGICLVVELNLYATKKELLTAFRKLLRDKHPGKKGRPDLLDTAEYPIASRMTPKALETALAVYDRIKSDPNEKPDFSMIGEEFIKAKKLQTGSSDNKKGLYDEVLRQYQLAERLINNIATNIQFKWSQFPLDK